MGESVQSSVQQRTGRVSQVLRQEECREGKQKTRNHRGSEGMVRAVVSVGHRVCIRRQEAVRLGR